MLDKQYIENLIFSYIERKYSLTGDCSDIGEVTLIYFVTNSIQIQFIIISCSTES